MDLDGLGLFSPLDEETDISHQRSSASTSQGAGVDTGCRATSSSLAYLRDLGGESAGIDWQANFNQAKAVAAGSSLGSLESAVGSSFADGPNHESGSFATELHRVANSRPSATTAIDDFFIKNGASRPPAACDYCRRLRLQCLILQTTTANPNPTKSCSSCVALFRECSLSSGAKRLPSEFETLGPVIGQLHGVIEQDGCLDDLEPWETAQSMMGQPSLPVPTRRKPNPRSVRRKTNPLRNWMLNHLDHPYPSKEEVNVLVNESSLSTSQVTNWFANARRRQRQSARIQNHEGNRIYLAGSPRPQALSESPMDRWRSSPPEEEGASTLAIQNAILNNQFNDQHTTGSSPLGWLDGTDLMANPNSDDGSSNSMSSNSVSSCFSFCSGPEAMFSFDPVSNPLSGSTDFSAPEASSSAASKPPLFQCTFCLQTYKKKYDWSRHERSVHLPGLDLWICSTPTSPGQSHLVWGIEEEFPRCIFCGFVAPTEEHFESHEFDQCSQRPVSERAFTRKDHLWQHFRKFHGCRKWDGWKPNLDILYHRRNNIQSSCGFCKVRMSTWEDRVNHLASHFKSGLTMDTWVGGCGIEEPSILDLQSS